VAEMAGLLATVRGIVQGVGFRYYVRRRAKELGLTGHVRNIPNGTAVEVVAEGGRAVLNDLVKLLQTGPSMARVDKLDIEWLQYTNAFTGFDIRF
jgi:acylphosphatase